MKKRVKQREAPIRVELRKKTRISANKMRSIKKNG